MHVWHLLSLSLGHRIHHQVRIIRLGVMDTVIVWKQIRFKMGISCNSVGSKLRFWVFFLLLPKMKGYTLWESHFFCKTLKAAYLLFLLTHVTHKAVARAPTNTTQPRTTTPTSSVLNKNLWLLDCATSFTPAAISRILWGSNIFSISPCFVCKTLEIFRLLKKISSIYLVVQRSDISFEKRLY